MYSYTNGLDATPRRREDQPGRVGACRGGTTRLQGPRNLNAGQDPRLRRDESFTLASGIMLWHHSLLSLFLVSSRVLVDAALPPPVKDYDVLQYIDPLIGSANGGM